MTKKNARGFTLIELLVVIAVIGILSSVVLASLNSARAKSRNAQRNTEIKQLISAFNLGLNGINALPIPANGSWVCVSAACYGGWSVYTADAGVDAFLLPGMSQKPPDPSDSARGYGGYLYYYNWSGGTAYDGSVFPAGSIINYLVELPLSTTTSCGPGRVWSVATNYVQCIAYINL